MPGNGGVCLHKGLKNTAKLQRRHADASVFNFDDQLFIAGQITDVDHHFAALGKFQRIAGQVQQNLAETQFIGLQKLR